MIERDFWFNVVSIQCFNRHLVNKTELNFRTIQPSTPLDEVLRKFGLPDRIDPYSSFHALVYTIGDGTEYHVFVWEVHSADGENSKVVTREKSVFKNGFGEDYLEPLAATALPLVGIAIFAIVTAIILLILRKKGLLCKKKQVREQGDSSI